MENIQVRKYSLVLNNFHTGLETFVSNFMGKTPQKQIYYKVRFNYVENMEE